MNTEVFLKSRLLNNFPITWDRCQKDPYEFHRFIQAYFTETKTTVYTDIFL